MILNFGDNFDGFAFFTQNFTDVLNIFLLSDEWGENHINLLMEINKRLFLEVAYSRYNYNMR